MDIPFDPAAVSDLGMAKSPLASSSASATQPMEVGQRVATWTWRKRNLWQEALTLKDNASEHATRLFKDGEQQQRLASQLQEKTAQLKSTVSTHPDRFVQHNCMWSA